MRDIIIHNWDDLQSAVFEDVWDPAIMRYRNNRVYRGMADCAWGLTPSLNRACPQDITLEKMILRSFQKYGYTELQSCSSFWEIVAMGLLAWYVNHRHETFCKRIRTRIEGLK